MPFRAVNFCRAMYVVRRWRTNGESASARACLPKPIHSPASLAQPLQGAFSSNCSARWVRLNQLPESSRNSASTPYGRRLGS